MLNFNSYGSVISGKVRDDSNDFDFRNFSFIFNELIRGKYIFFFNVLNMIYLSCCLEYIF